MTRYVRLYQKVRGKERYSDSSFDYKIQFWMFFIYEWENRCLRMKKRAKKDIKEGSKEKSK